MSPASLGALDPAHFISPMAVPGDGSTASMPHQAGCSTPDPCPSTVLLHRAVLLAVWHGPAAAGRGTWLGWVQCSPSHPGTPGSLSAPQLGGPCPPPPTPSVPDLGVSQPQGPSVPALALFIDRAGGCWAGTPPHSPSLARLSGCITSPSATHAPGSGTAAATCVPAVPTATSSWLKPLTPKAGLCPCLSQALRILAAPRPVPLVPQSPQCHSPGWCVPLQQSTAVVWEGCACSTP